ncbi:desert hedgehog protein isoform X1 [Seriola aureovittata]|uniref:desert hedgehog protein isoform X1 n=1 Tax=Seriola aureovittata TaxID=2871759 RepID=UPI0024BEE483|nr:desert hedgehog protein isoform X1 [Seriola aureovittata]
MKQSWWARLAQPSLLAAWTCIWLVQGCGPGPGYGSVRPRHRKLTAMHYKQFFPNFSENNLGASGRAEGKITRNSERFNELVCNYNPDIVFKDEENTNADRFMTKRCKDCLNKLAIAVMNQWPGVHLRVTEAWDEDGHHPPGSLHYEGRAVDITTDDRETEKYGLLAQLAVEAGFDWVHYESKYHIHCSVKAGKFKEGAFIEGHAVNCVKCHHIAVWCIRTFKTKKEHNLCLVILAFSADLPADHSVAVEKGGCFPGWARVTVAGGGQKSLSSLAPGDRVMALSGTGQVVFSQVILFLHRDQESWSTFLSLETEDGHRLALTPHHLVFLAPYCRLDSSEHQAQFASRAKTGDCVLIHTAEGHVRPSRIISVSVEESLGVYAPLTDAGTLFVDGVLASSYALVENHRLAHWAFGPLRLLSSFNQLLWGETTKEQQTTGETARTKTPFHCSTLATKDKAGVYVNNGVLNKRDNLSEPLRIGIKEKRSLQRQTSDVHWYARLLYSFGCIFLDSNSFHP